MSELKQIIEAYGLSAADAAVLSSEDTAHLVADGHRILSSRTVGGLEVVAQETAQGISATVTVKEGVRIENPVHLCFGVTHRRGTQKIQMRVKLERRSSAHFIAHCMFPNAERVKHIMDGIVELAEGAELRYSETHFHGPHGGVTVLPKAVVRVGEGARYFGDFTLTSGRVGRLDIDYRVDTAKDGVTELVARVFGHGDDRIVIREEVTLSGDNARSLIKTRVAIEDEATAEVTGITEGNAAGARGHVDCMEIVKDHAVAKAVPIVNVTNPLAKVTHEAAIGSIDTRQLETLMAHGLSPEEAVDLIVKAILG
jgi:hypothetical protein